MDDCIFCQIAAGKAPSFKVWEDDDFLAFLSIFPNIKGYTAVIPKKHYPSYVFTAPQEVVDKLMAASRKVARILEKKLPDVGKVGVMFEGTGVDHLHSKLFPLYGTKSDIWEKHQDHDLVFYDTYKGFISSQNGPRGDDKELAELAAHLRS
jgi:histidine triad (HIT) family protein